MHVEWLQTHPLQLAPLNVEQVCVPVPLCKYRRLTSPLEFCSATSCDGRGQRKSFVPLFPMTFGDLGEELREQMSMQHRAVTEIQGPRAPVTG